MAKVGPLGTYVMISCTLGTLGIFLVAGMMELKIGDLLGTHERFGISLEIFAIPSRPSALLAFVFPTCAFVYYKKAYMAKETNTSVSRTMTTKAQTRAILQILVPTLAIVYILYLAGVVDAELGTFGLEPRDGISIFMFAVPSHPRFLPAIVFPAHVLAKAGACCSAPIKNAQPSVTRTVLVLLCVACLVVMCELGELVLAIARAPPCGAPAHDGYWKKRLHDELSGGCGFFNLTANLNLVPGASGYLGNQMFVFQGAVAIAHVHGMTPVFALGQLTLLNALFELVENAARYNISIVEGPHEPPYPAKNADGWTPGGIHIKRRRNIKVGTYLQNIRHLEHIIDGTTGKPVSPRDLYRFRPRYIQAANSILHGAPERCIALHLRFFPANHLDMGYNTCPSRHELQAQINRLFGEDEHSDARSASRRDARSDWDTHPNSHSNNSMNGLPRQCLFVFSNDIAAAKQAVTAPCLHFVDPGQTHVREISNEVHPSGLDEVSRDFTALTLCRYGYPKPETRNPKPETLNAMHISPKS
jgi:hypothetical protein